MKLDLHLHSEFSWDSKVPIQAYVDKATQLNYDVIAITDHNSTDSHSIIDTIQPYTDICLVPGQEVSTAEGHLLAYGWMETIERDLSMEETVQIVKKNEGYCIAAHPFDPFRGGSFSRIFQTDIDGFELLNASAWFGFPNWLAKRAYRSHTELIGLGSSDSHRISEFGSAYSIIDTITSFDLPELFKDLTRAKPYGKRIGFLNKLSRLLRRKLF